MSWAAHIQFAYGAAFWGCSCLAETQQQEISPIVPRKLLFLILAAHQGLIVLKGKGNLMWNNKEMGDFLFQSFRGLLEGSDSPCLAFVSVTTLSKKWT